MQNDARNAGSTDVVTGALRTVVQPGANAVGGASQGISDFCAGMAGSKTLAVENRALRLKASAADIYAHQLDYLEGEIERLRALLDLPTPQGKTPVRAIITGLFPNENRITLSVGRGQGIKPGMPVVAGVGLVGVIQTVDARQSQALLLSSPQMRIGAIVRRNPAPAGLIRGESASKMILEIVDTSVLVEPGDLVTTSGHSELIPGGIPIGRVAQVSPQPEFGSIRCQVFPFVHIGDVREVTVLR